MTSPASIRKVIRSRRQSLSTKENRSHGESVSRHLASLAAFRRARRIAVYLSVNGELDTAPLIQQLLLKRKRLYLPVLHPFRHGRLLFCHWDGKRALVRNRYGIREPRCTSLTLAPSVHRLDVIIVPLVAFDASLNRIGMGGGYYDRTFGYARSFRRWKRPLLIGVAHHFQQVEKIEASDWDVRLDCVVTEEGLHV
ncbi:MAG: 5-formyltetrahydrofolate cyclo-ligase [Gammaproteobacteria bacterium]|jgi:5-formyltetrahydrofolate cyclo-ligase